MKTILQFFDGTNPKAVSVMDITTVANTDLKTGEFVLAGKNWFRIDSVSHRFDATAHYIMIHLVYFKAANFNNDQLIQESFQ